jgi:hypothetical protein
VLRGCLGPVAPYLNQSVMLHSCCCNAIHVIDFFHVFTFQVHLLLVGSITVTSYMVFLSNSQTFFTWLDMREHPPAFPDESSSFSSFGQSPRPLNLSGNLYRQKFGQDVLLGISSSPCYQRLT